MTFPLLSNLHQQSGMSLTAFQALLGLRHQTWGEFLRGEREPKQGLIDDAHQLIADREFWVAAFTNFKQQGSILPDWRVLKSAWEEVVGAN